MFNPFPTFDRYIQEHRYSRHSFVKYVLSGNATKEGLKHWAIQKYHQTYEQNRLFSALHSNAAEESIRQLLMEQLIAEETGLISGSDSHYNLMKRFALAMGATAEGILRTPIAPPVQRYLDYMFTICRTQHPVFGMLAIYVIESQTSESASLLAQSLKEQFNLTDDDLSWFIIHGHDDNEHSDSAREMILKYGSQIPDFEGQGLQIVKRGCREWLNLQNFYYSLIAGAENLEESAMAEINTPSDLCEV